MITISDTNKVSAYILDFMAFLRTITDILSTYQDLAWRVIKQIPTGYNRVDIIADTCRPVSIKMQEIMVEAGRIASSLTQLNQEPLVISRNFCQMVKTKLITLIIEYFMIKKVKVLIIYEQQNLSCRKREKQL